MGKPGLHTAPDGTQAPSSEGGREGEGAGRRRQETEALSGEHQDLLQLKALFYLLVLQMPLVSEKWILVFHSRARTHTHSPFEITALN